MSLVKKYLFSCGWMLFILFLTLSPGSSIPSVSIIGIDKIAHLFLFFIFVILLTIEGNRGSQRLIKYQPILIGFTFGVLIECLQLFVPDRSFSLLDIVANTSGIIIGVIFLKYFYRKNG